VKYIALALVILLSSGCQALLGLFGGAGIGAAATKTPEGAIGGGLAGFIIGGWNDLRNWWLSFWHSLSGAPGAAAKSASSGARGEVVQWVVLAAIVWLLYKLAFDYEFRGHVVGFFAKILNPKPKRKRSDAGETP
jgi:hypothetical protein